jgi:hypothetical protein
MSLDIFLVCEISNLRTTNIDPLLLESWDPEISPTSPFLRNYPRLYFKRKDGHHWAVMTTGSFFLMSA